MPWLRQAYASDAHQLGRYSEHRRRAILVATVLDLETGLTDAVLDMADKLIGGLFAKTRNTARRRYAASATDVGRLMRLFYGTIEALAAAQESDTDAFEAVDDTMGWGDGTTSSSDRQFFRSARASRSRTRCWPTRRRSPGSTSASPATSCGIAPRRLRNGAGRSASAGAGWPHDRCSRAVHPWRCLHNNRRHALFLRGGFSAEANVAFSLDCGKVVQ